MNQQGLIEAELLRCDTEAAPREIDHSREKDRRGHDVRALGDLPALTGSLQLVGRCRLVAVEILFGHQRTCPGRTGTAVNI
ncbi:hypothetical protein D3C71_1884820 [compost metagenome]